MSSCIKLNNGIFLPPIGFGTYLIDKKNTIDAVVNAIKSGYRFIDTAQSYNNEEEVGYAIAQCIAEGIVTREDLFIISKISPHNKIGFQEAINAVKSSLVKMDLDYIDCYLIHWPNVAPGAMWKKLNAETWRGFEECYSQGLIKSIGVSNFMIHHLEELLDTAKVKPVINQLHLSPIWQQKEVVQWCNNHDIQCIAWSPLVRFVDWAGSILQKQDYSTAEDWTAEIMKDLSNKYHKSKAQIALRWSLQKGFVPITKSIHLQRIKENIDLFDFNISDEDIKKMDSLNARPCNPDATPDSIYNSWSMSIALNHKKEIRQSFYSLFGLPIIKYKRINSVTSKYYLFNYIPLLKIRKINKKTKYYLLKFIPFLKSVQSGNVFYYYLFGKVRFAQKTIFENKMETNFLPNYYKTVENLSPAIPKKYNVFKDVLFNGFDNYSDYVQNKANNKILKKYMFFRFLITRKVSLPFLIIRVTNDCTLKCKECCAFTPYYKISYMASFDCFKRDLDKILESVDQIYYLNLFGGEPLLNPELDKMIEYANTKKQIKQVYFTTNGTIIPPESVLNAIKQKKGNFIYISDYRDNKSIDSLKQNEIVALLKEKEVPYFHIKHQFVSAWKINTFEINEEKDIEALKLKYYKCFEKNAHLVENGRYYCCTVARILDATKQYPIDESHYINLLSEKNLRKDFIEFFKKDYFKSCEVCDFSCFGYLRFPAVQLKSLPSKDKQCQS